MILRVNPNRMELLRLRKRLVLARRGHKLLQDKLEEMMRRFLILLKDINRAQDEFQTETDAISKDLFYCRMVASSCDFEKSLSRIHADISLTISTARIMNVKVPVFDIQKLHIDKEYDFLNTSAQLDVVVSRSERYLRTLLKLAGLLKSLEILSYEIERTRRRVNALEYMLIPSIQETIRSITQKLNEFERGNLVRLMRVKEIVRSH
ncbi:MAG: V-type ATP synthase subunit D [Candidatus Omnitrophica bacterium]|nr:V-type ATP synthase subunit D [Candidatus Omnitrophota bacterium]